MAKISTINRILDAGVVPIIRCDSKEQALGAAKAIHKGGLSVLEVTMTVPGALGILEKLKNEFGDDLLLGAGTVLDPETARACMLAGAEFLVTPGLDVRTIEIAKRYSIAILPGALTPTEILTAWQAGADMIKVFPCSAVGGASYIKAVKAPLPQVLLAPTGGVDIDNVGEFFKAGSDAVAVGSSLVDAKALREGRFGDIEKATAAFVKAVAKARV
jgi:2-dehydro-3-deoxyphosphogluconate aldolase/(4S)-4-hydroxy-2-oxoglutarate aldolase